MFKQALFMVAAGFVLTGCETGRELTIDPDFGNSVRQNVAVQTLNPDAGGPDGSIGIDGQRAGDAVESMRERDIEIENQSLIQSVSTGGN